MTIKINGDIPRIVVVIIAVFWPVCGHDFLGYDDEINIFRNSHVTQFSSANLWHFWTTPCHKLYIPLTYTLWAGKGHGALQEGNRDSA